MTAIAHHVTLPASSAPADIADLFVQLLGGYVRGQLAPPEPQWWVDEMKLLGTMNAEMLRALWDCYDGCNSPLGFAGETIHAALNLHGDGEYCAV